MMKKFSFIAATLLALVSLVSAQMDKSQDKSKAPLSPPASAECKFSDGKTIKVDYSSPRVRGRKIFGEASEKALVPYGEIWRTGANKATTFVSDASLTVGGKAVVAGSYTVFTIPKADKWTLIINKKTAEWGIPYKYEADELGRFDMQSSKTAAPVENFTIAFDAAGKNCTMRLEWENTRASIEIKE